MAQSNRPTFEHVDRMTQNHGWFRYQLITIESALWGRWSYWLAAMMNGRLTPLPDGAIPRLDFGNLDHNGKLAHADPEMVRLAGTAAEAKKHTFQACDRALRHGGSMGDLLRWWLYAFGASSVTERPALHPEAAIAMYADFDLGRLLAHPADWAAALCLEFMGSDRYGGWFPTPVEIVELMVRMQFGERDGQDTRPLSVHDPCVGTGIMLLCASNYSLNLSGQDINATMVAACEFNAHLFVPWLVGGRGCVKELRSKPAAVAAASTDPAVTMVPATSDPDNCTRASTPPTSRPGEQGLLFGPG